MRAFLTEAGEVLIPVSEVRGDVVIDGFKLVPLDSAEAEPWLDDARELPAPLRPLVERLRDQSSSSPSPS